MQAGLSQAELARKAGISQQHVSKIERGSLQPNLGTLTRLAAGLGMGLELRPSAESSPAEALLARRAMWKRLADFERKVVDPAGPAVRLVQTGELVDLFEALHGARLPDSAALDAHALGIREWRRRLAALKPAP